MPRVLSILFILTIQIFLLINNRQKTTFRYFIWNIEQISIGKLICVSFISGLLLSSLLHKTLANDVRTYQINEEDTKTTEKVVNEVTMEEECKSATLEEQRTNAVAVHSVPQSKSQIKNPMSNSTPETDVVREVEKARNLATTNERSRIREITSFCNKMQLGDDTLNTLLDNPDSTINDARAIYCDRANLKAETVESVQTPDIPEKELDQASIVAGTRAILTNDWSSREAGLIREISQEVESKGGKRTTANSFMLPYSAFAEKRATYVTSTNNVGGFLVPQDYRPADFIESLKKEN